MELIVVTGLRRSGKSYVCNKLPTNPNRVVLESHDFPDLGDDLQFIESFAGKKTLLITDTCGPLGPLALPLDWYRSLFDEVDLDVNPIVQNDFKLNK